MFQSSGGVFSNVVVIIVLADLVFVVVIAVLADVVGVIVIVVLADLVSVVGAALTVHFGLDESGFAEDRVAQGVASFHDELILSCRYEFLQRGVSRRARYRHHTSRFRL